MATGASQDFAVLNNLDLTVMSTPEESDLELSDPDSDYVPDSGDDSDASFVPVGILQHKANEVILEDECSSQVPDLTEQYCEQIPVVSSSNGSTLPSAKTKVDKRHYCLYCRKSFAKLKRHLFTVHKNEIEVARIAIANGDSEGKKKMKKEFCKMKNAGNHQHNLQVLRDGVGDMVVKKKVSNLDASNKDFVPCPKCLGYYYHRDLWRHNCPVETESNRKNQLQRGRLLCFMGTEEEKNMDEILSGLRNDPVAVAAKNDPLIKIFAQRECNLHYHDKDRHAHTRNKLRELGRLIICLREVTGRNDLYLSDFISPEYYKHIVKATKEIAGFDYSVSIFKTPSIGLKIGYSLSRCADLLRAKAIEKGDSVLREQCQDFFQIYSSRWHEDIANHALRSLKEGKRNNAKGVPLSEDIAALSNHLLREGENAKNNLESAKTTEDKKAHWERLSVVTLVRVIMFNRRRQGEASKVTVNDYLQGREQNHSKDVLTNLSQFEKALCEKLCRIEVVGKRGRTVPIIFTESMKESMECLLKFRSEVITNESNQYLFARIHKDSIHHIRGSDCLREVVKEIPLQQPDFIRSTALRKHIAIMTQLHNMKDNELDVLAQYMGHDIRIHREHYRLPSATIQVAKVAKFLLSMEQGQNSTEGENDGEENEDSSLEDDEPQLETDHTAQPSAIKRKTRTNAVNVKSRRKTNTRSHGGMTGQNQKDTQAHIQKDKTAHSKRDMSDRRGWSDAEKDFVVKHLGNFIYLGTVPGKAAVEKALEKDKNSILADRSWLQIKNYIRNTIVSRNKK